MAESKVKITFTCTPELKDRLQAWADDESRSLSNLCELVMQQANAARETKDKKI